jgi:predicted Zn-dependent peptidase
MRLLRLAATLWLSCLAYVMPILGFAAHAQSAQALFAPQYIELGNGLRVLAGQPTRTALFTEALLVVRAGTATTDREEPALIAAEALFAGRNQPTAAPLRLELARLGVSVDFNVGREVAVFRFAMPARTTSQFLQLLANLLDRTPDEDTWAEAIESHAQKVARERADPWQRALKELNTLTWNDRNPSSGVDNPAEKVTIDRPVLTSFWQRAYALENMVLAVWGPMTADDLIEMVRNEFSDVPNANSVQATLPLREPVRIPGPLIRCLEEAGASPAVLLVGVSAESDSDAAFYAWQMVAHILGSSHNSRLRNRLQTESQVVHSVEAVSVPVGSRGLLLRIVSQTDQLNSTHQIVIQELERLAREPVTQQELEVARALLRSRLRLDAASFRDQFYRVSLTILSHQHIRDPSAAEPLIAAFTPDDLTNLVSRTLRPDEASSIVMSRQPEPMCESRQ